MSESAESRITRYLDRAEALLEEAYLEQNEDRRGAILEAAARYDSMAGTAADHLRV